MTEPSRSQAKFLRLLKSEILKLDLVDLDFGIYRVLNYRRKEIERFFDSDLPAFIQEALADEGTTRLARLQERLTELAAKLQAAATDLGLGDAFVDGHLISNLRSTPKAQAYDAVRAELSAIQDDAFFAGTEEDRLYNVLYTFFSRYYRDGDFQPLPRRARDARYSVPYSGEDVHFHWRSRGSHYIKTTEELKSYTFRIDGWQVRLELIHGFQDADNLATAARYFFPLNQNCRTERSRTQDSNLFVVPFSLRPLTASEKGRYKQSSFLPGSSIQDRIIHDLAGELVLPTGLPPAVLLHHLLRYARKNQTDYFVHPHLGAFLRSELDYYLKNEFLDLEGLTSSEAAADRLLKLRVLRRIAIRIIDLLDDIESLQALLFQKRKFVLASNWCATVDRLPRHLWSILLQSEAQRREWQDLFRITVTDERDLATKQHLVFDTRLTLRDSRLFSSRHLRISTPNPMVSPSTATLAMPCR